MELDPRRKYSAAQVGLLFTFLARQIAIDGERNGGSGLNVSR